jgi:VanZ family protein
MSFVSTFLRLWLPPILWMALIFWFSAQTQLPGLTVTWLDWLLKHSGHFGGYAVLSLLWWRITARSFRDRYVAAASAFAGALLYAISDEIHQSFVPGRDASGIDLIIDGLGAASAMGVLLWRKHLGKRRVEATRSATMADSP